MCSPRTRSPWPAASPPRACSGVEKFEGVAYHRSALGLPVIDEALAEFECTIVHAYPGGDHTIFVGQVEALDARGDHGREPLLYYRGRFGRLL